MASFVMNHRHSPVALLGLLALLLLGGCQRDAALPPLQGAAIGGPFSLINQDGQRVTERDFAGRYRLMYFGFANCPDICPVDLQVIGGGLRQFERDDPARAERVQPIFVTVDPARDTPPLLKRYVATFHPRLVGLTGSPAEIEAAKRAFGIFGEAAPANEAGGYNVNHSRYILLMGPAGEPIAIVPHDRGPAAVAAELDRWVA
jgi:protein SCO1/2